MQEPDRFDRAVRGEKDALELLMAAHRRVACRIAFAVLGDADAADDVAQDLLVRLAAALPGFSGEDDLRGWAYRVTVNLCRDRLRSRQRRSRDVSIHEVADRPDVATESQPEQAVDLDRARAAVTAALDRLPEAQREVLMLRYAADLPYAEIARITSTAQGTIASRVFRALRRLGEELDPRHMEVLQ